MSPLHALPWFPSVPQLCSRATFSMGCTVSARVSIRGRRWETDDYIDRVLVPRADGRTKREVISIFGASVPGSMIGVALMRAVWTVAAPGHWYYLLPWSAPTSKITADERESENEKGGEGNTSFPKSRRCRSRHFLRLAGSKCRVSTSYRDGKSGGEQRGIESGYLSRPSQQIRNNLTRKRRKRWKLHASNANLRSPHSFIAATVARASGPLSLSCWLDF